MNSSLAQRGHGWTDLPILLALRIHKLKESKIIGTLLTNRLRGWENSGIMPGHKVKRTLCCLWCGFVIQIYDSWLLPFEDGISSFETLGVYERTSIGHSCFFDEEILRFRKFSRCARKCWQQELNIPSTNGKRVLEWNIKDIFPRSMHSTLCWLKDAWPLLLRIKHD